MTKFQVAALQLGPASASIAHTTERILTLLDKAAERGVTLSVLPELALTPYFAAKVHDLAQAYANDAENAAALEAVSAKARETGMAVVLPFAEMSGNRIFNSMAFLDDKGRRVGLFRKMHIPGFDEPKPNGEMTILEKRYFQPGDLGFGVFDMGNLKLGGLICYDRASRKPIDRFTCRALM